MERMRVPEGCKDGALRRAAGKLCGLLIAAMLAGGLQTGGNVSTYAAEIGGGSGNPAVTEEDGTEELPEDGAPDEDQDLGEVSATPVPTEPDAELAPTKRPGKGEITPTPTPVGDAEEAEPTPTKKPGKGEATPTPTKKPGKGETTPTPKPTGDGEETPPTPTKKPGKGETTPTPKPTGDGEEATPTPTKKPGKGETTPTPKPTGDGEEATPTPTKKPGKGETTPTPKPTGNGEAEPTPTKKPAKGEATPTPTEDGEKVTPTPKPTKTPTWAVPTESDDARYQYLLGIDAKVITIDNPPEGYKSAAEAAKNMKTITIPVWKMTASGKKYTSSAQLTVNKKLVKNVQAIFDEIYALDLKFPIKVIKGYMYRKVGGVGLSKSRIMSIHSFGAAIDINPSDYDNDYFLGKGNDLRDKSNPYCIPDEVIAIFEKYGWFWGGNFEICADTMHFQYFELGMLTYQGNSPFRTLKVKSGYMTGTDVRNLQQRLCELGFNVSVDGVYGSKTASAVKKYQKSRGLAETGEVDYKTWETIINETHYMAYAF